ncbi:MAG: hypothetical protein J7K40_09940 [candidate division Zixibacteria bacterium]|nr:hypothetical protein [candidate division Zixibacteria bacterium]
MKKKQSNTSQMQFEHRTDAFNLGPAYLEYCVHKGWLEKEGEGDNAQYVVTEKGKNKLGDVQLNFDLSVIDSKGDGPKKIRRRHKK